MFALHDVVRISEQLPRFLSSPKSEVYYLSRLLFLNIPLNALQCMKILNTYANMNCAPACWTGVCSTLHFAGKCPGLLLVILVPRQLLFIPRSIVCQVYQSSWSIASSLHVTIWRSHRPSLIQRVRHSTKTSILHGTQIADCVPPGLSVLRSLIAIAIANCLS